MSARSDDARQMSRSRLPLPPVPAASRSAAGRPSAVRTPSTTAAPFQAVPTPERAMELPLDDVPAAPQVERRKRARTAAPERPRSSWHDAQSAMVTTGPSGLRSSEPAPRVPRQTTADGSSAPAYGDWTKPSRSGDVAPGTTAIPERSVSRRGRRAEPVEHDRYADDAYADDPYVEDYADDRYADEPAPAPARGAGPVTGGRAAMRAERQARDAARRKAQKQKGSAVAVLEEDAPRKPRRVLKGLIAMTVVALGVLGVYTVVSPETEQVAAQTQVSDDTSSGTVAPPSEPLPELEVAPLEVAEPTTAAPIRLPVTVLNSTDINGLAAKIAGVVTAGGWESPGVGAYTGGDVSASTVYFTEGDENMRQAALQLKEQFPQLQGPAPRFFEMPADVPAPGLVVVATGDWQP